MSLIQTFPSGASGDGSSTIQIETFPAGSATDIGKIYQYIGVTDSLYRNGCFYQCILNTNIGVYEWKPISVEDPATYEDEPIDFSSF